MEIENLNLEQMENLEGGWSWSACLGGAIIAVSTGAAAYATGFFGPAGTAGALIGGCVLNNVM